MDIIDQLATELTVNARQVQAAVDLLDEGATVPFIARYRKELTGGLDDQQLRTLEERLTYLRELASRKTTILDSIKSQNKLTPELEQAIQQAQTKTLLEDLYLPYKPKRRTKAQIAREAGLQGLADMILEQRDQRPEDLAQTFLNPEHQINSPAEALEGAKQIIMETLSENAALLQTLRERLWENGILHATIDAGKEQEAQKFKDYFDYQEAMRQIPSHRALALFRGRNEGFLTLTLYPGSDQAAEHDTCSALTAQALNIVNTQRPGDAWLAGVAKMAWKVKLFTRIDLDLKLRLREAAEQEAIQVFAHNLKDLLLAAPAGPKATMGVDPGIRTGVKIAVVDGTGKLLDYTTIYPHPPKNQWDASIATLAALIAKHQIDLVSIGNGTGSRETDQLFNDLKKQHRQLTFSKMIVSEAGASVYSASELASQEFPELDVTIRGAISIARRLQDPLAELVKIEPKSIGVGQYQHDVNQTQLSRSLDSVVEDCVNAVGVDVNTASAALLKQVSGLTASISENIVKFRDANGAFNNRQDLKKVPRLGEKAFEQAAGFLRIMNGNNPLDASAVHPEAYPVVNAIIEGTGKSIQDLIGQRDFLRSLKAANFTSEQFGLPTVTDILQELEKPGRDPRPEFKSVKFKEGVEDIKDLQAGMELEGVVTNVANFGAFIDIGVHQDGFVHISQLADRFVKDPRDVVKTGQTVKVKVLEIDLPRKRIALSMKSNATSTSTPTQPVKPKKTATPTTESPGSMASALSRALGR